MTLTEAQQVVKTALPDFVDPHSTRFAVLGEREVEALECLAYGGLLENGKSFAGVLRASKAGGRIKACLES